MPTFQRDLPATPRPVLTREPRASTLSCGFSLLFVTLVAAGCSTAGAKTAGPSTADAGGFDASVGEPEDASALAPGDTSAASPAVDAGADGGQRAWCNQSILGYTPPATTARIVPTRPIRPFYQWQSNNGYCGEVSLLQAAMNNGLWASQYNVRLLCGFQSQGDDGYAKGTPLLQSGPDGYCAAHTNSRGVATAQQASQLLIDDGDAARGQNSVLTCAANAGLAAVRYITPSPLDGQPAFQNYIVWLKQHFIAGHAVTAGVLTPGGQQDEYDHIVSVASVGTNHAASDSSYYDDDVVYFEDHGAYTFDGASATNNPAVPPGAGAPANSRKCTPYIFGVRVGDLAKSRASLAAATNGQPYAMALPNRSAPGGALLNYAFAVTGPLDDAGVTLPVVLSVEKTSTNGADNPRDPVAGYQYETPYIGTSNDGESCTNAAPSAWMTMHLRVEVHGLTAGNKYNLYRYEFDRVGSAAVPMPVGALAALAVPKSGFNAKRASATAATTFTATAGIYAETITLQSSRIVVFRAVPVEAP